MLRSWTVLALVIAACGRSHGSQSSGGGGGDDVDAATGANVDASSSGSGSGAGSGAPSDAATTTDAGAGVVTGGPCASGAAGATLLRIGFKDVRGFAEVVYVVDGTPNTAGYAEVDGYTFNFAAPYAGSETSGGIYLDSTDFMFIDTSTAAISQLTSITLSIDGQTGGSGISWQSNLGSGHTAQYAIAESIGNAWFSVDVTPAFAAADPHSGVEIKTLPSDGAILVHQIELCAVAQ